ncbi:MAG: flagellar basal body rod C-terminal domain-containing protein, partial [Sulfurimicrobium sp.]|nr:flagellar basal body rod C-terminal domain-containing protein [Sulfurimicrobium sp.]
LAQTMNDQHRLGQDLNGALGGALFNVMGPNGTTGAFSVPSAKVVANLNNSNLNPAASPVVTLSDVSKVTTSDYTLAYSTAGYSLTRLSDNAVLWPGATAASSTNTGSGTISTASVTLPTNAALPNNVSIVFNSPTDFNVTDNTTSTVLATNVAYNPAGTSVSYNGWTVQLSGTQVAGNAFTVPGISTDGLTVNAPATPPTAGDSWLIQPTRYGARDISVAIHDTAKIAAAAPIIAEADFVNNTGTGKISAGVVNVPVPPPTDPNLQKPVTITFTSATTFDVSSPSSVPPIALTGVPYIEGADISYNGWTVKITGAPEANDTFTVGPNSNGVSDNRNALLLVGLQTQNTLAGSTASYQSAYSQIVSSIGIKTRDINVTAQAQASLVKQSQQAQQSLSGVNLDEEAANLLRYQQAYQAAGKMMQIASTMFDTLLGLGR